MGIKIYNTLTRNKEDFVPIVENTVSMYVCGPTVYHFAHIGNIRPMVAFDAVRRYFIYKGYNVKYAVNFTDVDDKIIANANKENVETKVISERYIDAFLKDIADLNVVKPDFSPKVTEEMPLIIQFIKELQEKEFAYEVEGTVFFDSTKLPNYGKLSKKNIEDLEAGARVEFDTRKHSTVDFVLWKPAKPDEPKWNSPWGNGRPGWHIECSAMIKQYLGNTIDIHAGGEDLIFPHHENEIAQSEACNSVPLANYWMHNGMVNVNNQKMSKSKNNFFTLQDIAENFSHDVIRFYILSVHYRSPINISADMLEAAKTSLERIKNCFSFIDSLVSKASDREINDNEKEIILSSEQFTKQFEDSMNDDFNTANAITAIFEFVRFINTNFNNESDYSKKALFEIKSKIKTLTDILAIETEFKTSTDIDSAKIEELISQRNDARKNKNFAESDRIRDLLSEMGVEIKDTREGTQWVYRG